MFGVGSFSWLGALISLAGWDVGESSVLWFRVVGVFFWFGARANPVI